MKELMVLPHLYRQQYNLGGIRYRYCNNNIEPFKYIASINGRGGGGNIVTDSNELLNEKVFKENLGEWMILDNPVLVVTKRYFDSDDDYEDYLDYSIAGKEEITPGATMTVTLNGDNAYKVFLPLGECCRDSNGLGYDHYYYGGFVWEERPFEQIMNLLRKGNRIGYTYCAIKSTWHAGYGCQYGGGFRVFET